MRGDIYYAYINKGIGSEQSGYRPVLIIQNDRGNQFSPTVIVVALTAKIKEKKPLPTHYILSSSKQLELTSMVLAEQIATIDKRRLKRYIGNIGAGQMKQVDRVLAVSIGLT